MLARLKATNFQTHKEVDIRFHPGVNVITGPSDAGKSSIIRMIRWTGLNKPSGKTIVKRGTTETQVELFFDNGVVEKERKKDVTTYTVNGTVLKAVGRKDVPTEVSEITKLEEKNFQTQHNPYFLLVKSPGEVAKELNDLAGISIIDKLFFIINSEYRKAKSELLSVKETIPEVKEKIASLEYVDDLKKKVEKFAILLKGDKKKREQVEELSNIISDMQEIDNEERESRKQLQHEKEVNGLIGKSEELLAKKQREKKLSQAISDYIQIKEEIKEEKSIWVDLEGQRERLMKGMEKCPLCNTILEEK